MVAQAKARIRNLSMEQVEDERRRGDVLLVDVRDVREVWREGTIPGARHVPRGMLEFWADSSSEYHKEFMQPDRRLILFCAGGLRSALAADALTRLGYGDVAHLEIGFDEWKRRGGETVSVEQKRDRLGRAEDAPARGVVVDSYAEVHARSLREPEEFWGEVAGDIDWARRPRRVLDAGNPPFYRWFAGGMLNTCHNALDRHVEAGRGEPARPDLRQSRDRRLADVHLRRAAGRCGAVCGRSEAARRPSRRSDRDLHADGPRGRRLDAGLPAAGGDARGRVRRVRRARAGCPDR